MKFPSLTAMSHFLVPLLLLVAVILGMVTWSHWAPGMSRWVDRTVQQFREESAPSDSQTHSESQADTHDHQDHAGHSAAQSLKLSEQALRNIGLTEEQLQPVRLETFQRSITVPARVVEQPGRSRVQVATPLTGMVTHVHAVQGEAIEPGTLLFRIRLTHEDLVNAQTEFVKALGELEVEEREIARLEKVTQTGAVAGKVLLEREYERDKLAAVIRAQREALKLHGLSDDQINQIAAKRELLQELKIYAPHPDQHAADEMETAVVTAPESQPVKAGPLILQELSIHKGESVAAGETLCVLTNYRQLFIEGMAFEQDIPALRNTSRRGWSVQGIIQSSRESSRTINDLSVAYLSNEVDPESRTLRFYVSLPNQVAIDRQIDGNRYVEWTFLPGQRLQLRIPVEQWENQIVLPLEAVAREGAESFVFQQNGNHFDRVPVHVKYRDQFSAVIENDGSLFPGDVVAQRGAHQMQMTLKHQSGGAPDPHAGHNH